MEPRPPFCSGHHLLGCEMVIPAFSKVDRGVSHEVMKNAGKNSSLTSSGAASLRRAEKSLGESLEAHVEELIAGLAEMAQPASIRS